MADGDQVWFAKRRFGWSQPIHWKGLALMAGTALGIFAVAILFIALFGPSPLVLIPVGIVAVMHVGLVEKHSARG